MELVLWHLVNRSVPKNVSATKCNENIYRLGMLFCPATLGAMRLLWLLVCFGSDLFFHHYRFCDDVICLCIGHFLMLEEAACTNVLPGD
jgi:hypothetical protein